MMKYEYKSILAPIIESFIDMKRGLGFKYVNECKSLRRIDQSALNHKLDKILDARIKTVPVKWKN